MLTKSTKAPLAGSLTPEVLTQPSDGEQGMPCWDDRMPPTEASLYKVRKQPTYHTHKNAKSSSDKMMWQRNASQAKRQDKSQKN